MELLDFRKRENPVTWTSALTIARPSYEQGSTYSRTRKIGATAPPITSEKNSFSYIILQWQAIWQKYTSSTSKSQNVGI